MHGLERKGAIVRLPNPADGRSALIAPTRSGKLRRERIEADLVAENARVLSGFTAPVRVQLISLIRALTQAASARQLERVAEDSL